MFISLVRRDPYGSSAIAVREASCALMRVYQRHRRADRKDETEVRTSVWSALQRKLQGENGATLAVLEQMPHLSPPVALAFRMRKL
jgi:uncharacterized protein (DUF2267 family)